MRNEQNDKLCNELYELRIRMYKMERSSQDFADSLVRTLKGVIDLWDNIKDDDALEICVKCDIKNAIDKVDDFLRDVRADSKEVDDVILRIQGKK